MLVEKHHHHRPDVSNRPRLSEPFDAALQSESGRLGGTVGEL
jgi:hypothetical protein